MGLTRGSSGHLLKAPDGHLAKSCVESPPPPIEYRQARKCGDSSLVDLWATDASATLITGAFQVHGDSTCYKFNLADATSTTPGTLASIATTYASCSDCDPSPPCGCSGTMATTLRLVFSGMTLNACCASSTFATGYAKTTGSVPNGTYDLPITANNLGCTAAGTFPWVAQTQQFAAFFSDCSTAGTVGTSATNLFMQASMGGGGVIVRAQIDLPGNIEYFYNIGTLASPFIPCVGALIVLGNSLTGCGSSGSRTRPFAGGNVSVSGI